MKKTIYFVLGQTATGKTSFATNLAKKENGELINCDSRQTYKHLDIITAKVDNPKDIAVHCVDILNPDKPFSAYEYANTAFNAIGTIASQNKVPIVVGGTGMYAYLLKFFDPKKEYKVPEDIRYFDSFTLDDLQKKIQNEYSFIWERLNDSDKKNKRRLSSALQRLVFQTSLPIDIHSENNLANTFHIKEYVFLHKSKESQEEILMQRIEDRIKMGAIEECRELLDMGYSEEDPGLMSIGYQTVFKFLGGKISEAELRQEWLTKEKQYAKRQKTYFLKYFPSAEIIYV